MVIEKFTTALRPLLQLRCQSRQNNADGCPNDTLAHSRTRVLITYRQELEPSKLIAQVDFTKAHLSNAPHITPEPNRTRSMSSCLLWMLSFS